jgi:hypothetical protein
MVEVEGWWGIIIVIICSIYNEKEENIVRARAVREISSVDEIPNGRFLRASKWAHHKKKENSPEEEDRLHRKQITNRGAAVPYVQAKEMIFWGVLFK